MIQEFIRVYATDTVEMCGILYTPEIKTDKAIIHVHGLAGNFYENRFVSYLAKKYTELGYTFLTLNNRGYGYFTELLKGVDKVSYVAGGAYSEIFEECIYDIEGAIKYLDNLGYNEYILQGHSYGCNKVVYYYNKIKLPKIKHIILLAPCDVFSELKREYEKDYDKYIDTCRKKVAEGNGNDVIVNVSFPPMAFTAKTLTNNFLEGVEGDIFRYREYDYISDVLQDIDIPIICIIGEKDNAVFTENKEKIDNYLKRNILDIRIEYIKDSGHTYLNHESKLVDLLEQLL